MKNRTDLFNDLSSGTKWDAGVAFNRTNGLPLDDKSIFASYADLMSYVTNNPVAYAGQVVGVVNANNISDAYIINADGTVSKLAGSGELNWNSI